MSGSLELPLHEPQNVARAPHEEELHDGIIEGDPFTHKEVEIAREKYGHIESLRLE
jgi:hypothetical protein